MRMKLYKTNKNYTTVSISPPTVVIEVQFGLLCNVHLQQDNLTYASGSLIKTMCHLSSGFQRDYRLHRAVLEMQQQQWEI